MRLARSPEIGDERHQLLMPGREIEQPADRFHRVRVGGMAGDVIDALAVEIDGPSVTQARNMVEAGLDHARSPVRAPAP